MHISHKLGKRLLCTGMALLLSASSTLPVFADMIEEAEARKSMPVESNEIQNWPMGPLIGAESAVVMDVDTGAILYQKNMHAKEYPASTTKVMTCLLAVENCSLDEMVTFSHDAVFGIEYGSSNVGMDEGQSITMEQALYCIMLASANEVAAAVAEHVSGSVDDFAVLMNKRAEELGCTETHFVNANGLHDENHYTSAHDLALITAAYFRNETLTKIANTRYYEMHPTPTQPDDFAISNHHKMLKGQAHYNEYVIGGKTGYTNAARQTLTTCAQKNGMKLVCTIMREEAPNQYTDTQQLLDYGFDNFQHFNIADNETRYSIDNDAFFKTNNDIFGSSKTIFSINPIGNITLPNTALFSEAEPRLEYNDQDKSIIADIHYYFEDNYVGSTSIDLASSNGNTFEFGSGVIDEEASGISSVSGNSLKDNVVFVNFILVGSIILGIIGILFVVLIIRSILQSYNFSRKRRRRSKKKNFRYHSEFDDFKF